MPANVSIRCRRKLVSWFAYRSFAALDGGALTEQRVGFVEQEDGVSGLGGVEQGREVLLGLADPLRDDLSKIDLVDLGPEILRDQTRAHRLARAGRARKQRRHTEPLAQLLGEPPVLVDPAARTNSRE